MQQVKVKKTHISFHEARHFVEILTPDASAKSYTVGYKTDLIRLYNDDRFKTLSDSEKNLSSK